MNYFFDVYILSRRSFGMMVPKCIHARLCSIILLNFKGTHQTSLEELHKRYENKKQLLTDELKHNFSRMRDIFNRDDERLELMSLTFEARNDDETKQIHANFEDSIAVLNNEVFRLIENICVCARAVILMAIC